MFEGKTPLTLKFDGIDNLVQKCYYYFEYRSNQEKKRKRSVLIDDQNDELIDKAFKSRLITKLGFSGSSDYDMSLFGDNFSESWSMTKENLEKQFSDSKVLNHLKSILDTLDASDRKKVKISDQVLDAADKHGFCLTHYFCFFGFYDCLLYLKANSVDFGKKARDWISPLHIAINGNDQRVVDLLLLGKHQAEADDGLLDFSLIKANKERIEKFLRKVSLNESLSNSAVSGLPSVDGYPLPEDEEEEQFFSNMFSLLSTDQASEKVIHALANHPPVGSF